MPEFSTSDRTIRVSAFSRPSMICSMIALKLDPFPDPSTPSLRGCFICAGSLPQISLSISQAPEAESGSLHPPRSVRPLRRHPSLLPCSPPLLHRHADEPHATNCRHVSRQI